MACGVDPITDMNPVLLKPETDVGAQVIVAGPTPYNGEGTRIRRPKTNINPPRHGQLQRIGENCDLIIVEGAGSPAETNLRTGDIANMGFADAANIPVIVLLGDIDRGGVIAQMVGTHGVLPDDDLARIKGFMINKFRGDVIACSMTA